MNSGRSKQSEADKNAVSLNAPFDRLFETAGSSKVVRTVPPADNKKSSKKNSGGKSPKTSGEFSRRTRLGETGVYGNVEAVASTSGSTTPNRPLKELDFFRQFCEETAEDDKKNQKDPAKRKIAIPLVKGRDAGKKSPTKPPNKRTPFVEKYADATYGKPSRFGHFPPLEPPT